jgi:hypothetical protein
MASWSINYWPWGGITVSFNEQETQSLLSGENTAEDIDQALSGIPFLDLITTVLELWLEAEHALAQSLDKGNGISLLLPWVAIAEGVIGGIIPYPNGSAPAQPNITNNQQHINYVTSDSAVHELYYVNNWGHVVVTAAANVTGNSLPSPQTLGIISLNGFGTPWNGQEHIDYVSNDGNVQELMYPPNGPWRNTVLTGPTAANVAPGLRPVYGSPIIGFATYWNQQQHIIFINGALDICELTYADKGGWGFTAVSGPGFANLTGQDFPAAPVVTGLTGYGTPWDSAWHINYIARDGGVHQVYWGEANGWQHASLTSSGFANVTGADLPLSNSPLASYITSGTPRSTSTTSAGTGTFTSSIARPRSVGNTPYYRALRSPTSAGPTCLLQEARSRPLPRPGTSSSMSTTWARMAGSMSSCTGPREPGATAS